MSAPTWPFLAASGLLVGVGVRSAVWRLAVEVPPRTRCPRCGTVSRWLLAPVQPLTGRCTRCSARTTPAALVPELFGAAGFGLAGWIGGGPLWVAALCWLATFGLAAVLVDTAVQRLPYVLTWPCLAGVTVLCCGQAAVSGSWAAAVRTILAGAAVAVLFLILAYAVDIGLGDVVLGVSLGVVLGFVSGAAVLVGIGAGFVLAGLLTGMALVTGRTQLSGSRALGPPLLAGAFVVLGLATR